MNTLQAYRHAFIQGGDGGGITGDMNTQGIEL
jgi:hypothetical protein